MLNVFWWALHGIACFGELQFSFPVIGPLGYKSLLSLQRCIIPWLIGLISDSLWYLCFFCFVDMCFVNLLSLGKKVSDIPLPKKQKLKPLSALRTRKFIPNLEFVDQINNVQSSWKAGVYEEYNGMTVEQLMRRAGGRKKFDSPKTRSVRLQC